ncbi:MAG: N-acetyltransferase [Candidatus Marinimicrobia bacterium]|nr:N-acetyltransferase [Candidatus Neomarinimicrobiota bacterium]MCK4447670.1 N-acetyltransferase [Candidatus Neomarinimicrobiota bacterium]
MTIENKNVIIEKDVIIGKNLQVGYNVVIRSGTIIGDNVRIDDNTVIGKRPMRASISTLKEEKVLQPTYIGNNCLIGSNTVIYIGANIDNDVMVADLASIRENTFIGEYTIVGRGVTVENNVFIGKRCKLESECYITAYSELEDYVFIAPGVVTSNDNYLGRTEERFKHFKGVTVKRGGRIGAGAVILPGKVIGEDALVAAGSVVTKDVPARKVVMGAPARVIRDVAKEQLIENQKFYERRNK